MQRIKASLLNRLSPLQAPQVQLLVMQLPGASRESCNTKVTNILDLDFQKC